MEGDKGSAAAAGGASAADRVARALGGEGGGGAAGGGAAAAAGGAVDAGAGDGAAAGAADAGVAAGAAGADAGAAGFVSKADAQKMIDAAVGAALSKSGAQRDASDTRNRFIVSKMADLPPMLHDLMPKTGDLKALAKAEQDIREALKGWLASERAAKRLPPAEPVGGNVVGVPGAAAMPPGAWAGVNNQSAFQRVASAMGRMTGGA